MYLLCGYNRIGIGTRLRTVVFRVRLSISAPNCAKAQNLPTWSVMPMKVSVNFKSEDSPIGWLEWACLRLTWIKTQAFKWLRSSEEEHCTVTAEVGMSEFLGVATCRNVSKISHYSQLEAWVKSHRARNELSGTEAASYQIGGCAVEWP